MGKIGHKNASTWLLELDTLEGMRNAIDVDTYDTRLPTL